MPPKAKIMVVEDDLDEAELLKMILESEGYEALCALNGKDALEKLESARPDLIILDIMMPEMDGFAFCSRFRSSPENKDTPIILMTAVAQHIQDSRYPLDGVMRAEAEEYLEKPIEPEELLKTVARLLQ